MPNPTARDERRSKRVKIDLLVNRYVDGQPYMCRALDLSAGGMRIAPLLEPVPSSASSAPTRFVGLEFQLPGTESVLTASGELVAPRAPGAPFGIRFTRVPAAAGALLAAFVAKLAA